MNPENPVIRLCSQGMQAEAEGRDDDAREHFQQAWELAADDYEASIAAHYLARHQPSPEQALRWNQESLARAERVADERVAGFFTSLHLNLARSYRDVDRPDRAQEHFAAAARHIGDVPPGQYADWTRFAIAEGLRPVNPATELIDDLIAEFCARRDLKALALVLPARLGDLGTDEDRTRLRTALHMLHAARWLPDGEQDALGRAITALTPA
ncbi:hypothetical protein LZ318_41025 [Saccharopolyspora indica]|uniref:hypothetical protein n=1 Tax=Saccharopolyspora indica TaxID=1229659 RepID=UPI0022EAE6E3|nr:hypothetical protein [Saccharopolyspora indica]MDA3646829.1 hypothetical protein [Saccharopolyspora indica]